jgi:transposase
MTEQLTFEIERIDDIPLLLAQLERMQIGPLLDEHFPTHGNWQGLSLGTVSAVWLAFILSEGDHRMSHVQAWAEARLQLLGGCLGDPVRALDFTDDRLATVLDAVSDDAAWEAFERALTGQLLRVYDLRASRVRVDSTTAKGYVEVDEVGLFQFGHSKDHRPDLPQVKINLAALDPLGLPLSTTVVSGERADDPLYVPEIGKVQHTLGQAGLTYIGDCKMAALATRAYLVASGDHYLCPLPSGQLSAEQWDRLLTSVWEERQALTPVYRASAETGLAEQLAEGFRYEESVTGEHDGRALTWTEQRWVVRSLKLAECQERTLRRRLEQAVAAIAELNVPGRGKKRFTEEAALAAAVEALIAKHRVAGLLQVDYQTQIEVRPKRRYRDRPARVERTPTFTVQARIDAAALAEAVRRLGWRVYATDQAELSLTEAVLAYREAYFIERGFGRLKGRPLSLTPMYLDSDARVKGLIRLLSVGLRVLTLIEFSVRQRLRQEGVQLGGLYAGNPKRVTARPTTEMLLRVFTGLTLVLLHQDNETHVQLTALTPLQRRILELLDFPLEVYTRLTQHFSEPMLNLSEP